MIKYIVVTCIIGVLVTVAYQKEREAFNRCLINSSQDTCMVVMAGH